MLQEKRNGKPSASLLPQNGTLPPAATADDGFPKGPERGRSGPFSFSGIWSQPAWTPSGPNSSFVVRSARKAL